MIAKVKVVSVCVDYDYVGYYCFDTVTGKDIGGFFFLRLKDVPQIKTIGENIEYHISKTYFL